MAALPYMPFYVADFKADTAHLTLAQRGVYMELIMNYWQTGKALNNADERLASVVGLQRSNWLKIKYLLAEFFSIDGDIWTHGRIEAELEKVHKKSTQASYAGSESARKRANERLTDVERTFNHTDTDTDKRLSNLPILKKEAFDLATMLATRIEANGSKRPTVSKSWINDIDLLMRADGKTTAEVQAAIQWSQSDPFWRAIILSPKKLRQKYDQMRLQSVALKDGKPNIPTPAPPRITKEETERKGVPMPKEVREILKSKGVAK